MNKAPSEDKRVQNKRQTMVTIKRKYVSICLYETYTKKSYFYYSPHKTTKETQSDDGFIHFLIY